MMELLNIIKKVWDATVAEVSSVVVDLVDIFNDKVKSPIRELILIAGIVIIILTLIRILCVP
jgi:hypothetical protein